MAPVMGRVVTTTVVWARAAAALLAMCLLAVGVPWLLLATVGNPVPGKGWDWFQPLTNGALLGLLAVLGWLFWAQMVLCLIVEVVAELRIIAGRSGKWMTQIPGTFGGQQHLARVLVQAVVAVGIGAGMATVPTTSGMAPAAARVEPPTTHQPTVVAPGTAHLHPDNHASKAGAFERHSAGTLTVEVNKGDSLWSIAERHLGSGEQWRRIAELNEGRLMPDGERFVQASSIQPGWQLLIPAPRTRPATGRPGEVSVASGDTLWSLADASYGEGDDWPRIYDANRDRLTDPDLIYPGQVLKVPDHGVPSAAPATEPERPNEMNPPRDTTPPDHVTTSPHSAPEPAGGPANGSRETPTVPEPASGPADPGSSGRADYGHLAATLAGGGGLLAGSALVMFLAHRRRQFRLRRSGRAIAATPAALVSGEATLRTTGSAGGDAAHFSTRHYETSPSGSPGPRHRYRR